LDLNLFLDLDISDDSDEDNDKELEDKHRRHKSRVCAACMIQQQKAHPKAGDSSQL
jgi:hypothetical protein